MLDTVEQGGSCSGFIDSPAEPGTPVQVRAVTMAVSVGAIFDAAAVTNLAASSRIPAISLPAIPTIAPVMASHTPNRGIPLEITLDIDPEHRNFITTSLV